MIRPTTIQEAFYPLNERLLSFEDNEFLDDLDAISDGVSIARMRKVYLDACLFDEELVSKYANKYINRIKVIYGDLEEKIKAQKWNDEWEMKILADCYSELANYYFYLEKLQNVSSDQSVSNLSENHSRIYELHEKFDLRKVKKHENFESKLSAMEAATLLYYLYKSEFSPEYSASARGRIANALFWISEKTITESYEGNQPIDLNEKNTTALIDKLKELILFIDSDIKSGFKK